MNLVVVGAKSRNGIGVVLERYWIGCSVSEKYFSTVGRVWYVVEAMTMEMRW